MLRTALASVAAQTALDEIAEVIVSENAGDPASGDVCAEFPTLPIKYRLRQPPVPIKDHLNLTLSETQGSISALLHDDDWWSPDHLAASLRNLDQHPSAALSLGALLHTNGENCPPRCHDSLQFWLGAGAPEWRGIWLLDRAAVAVSNLANTAGHYSTVVAKTEILTKVQRVIAAAGNPYDNDRMFFFEFTRYGPVVFDPIPRVFIRTHAAADNRRYVATEIAVRVRATSEWILAGCASDGIDIGKELATRAVKLGPGALPAVAGAFRSEARDVLRERDLLPIEWVPPPPPSLSHRILRKLRLTR
jgi:hypothetical protein